MKFTAVFNSPIGNIYVENDEHALLKLSLTKEDCYFNGSNLTNDVINQLNEYFSCRRRSFNLPLNPIGSEFQKRVWNELLNIPYGKTASYKEIAKNIGNPCAARAAGNANNKNPIPIIIPCHRVIGSNKKLTGYAFGLDIKQKLLDLEAGL